MNKKALFVIANKWFQDYEYSEPRYILESAWVEIIVASNIKWECEWVFWSIVIADYSLVEVDWWNFDAVVMVWWPWAWQAFNKNSDYLRISKQAKILWAICIAPTLVSDSWLYKWVNVTWWNNSWEQQKYIENNGWIFTWEDVTISWKYVTANWPKAALKFWEELLKIISNK